MIEILLATLRKIGIDVETIPRDEAISVILNELPSGSMVTAWWE